MQGRFVRIEFYSADAQAAAAVKLYDEDGNEVTLAANERLLIDTLNLFGVAAVTSAILFDDRAANGTPAAGEYIAVFGNGSNHFEGGPEGFACMKGAAPKVKAAAAGIVSVSGSGHIIQNGDSSAAQTWKA